MSELCVVVVTYNCVDWVDRCLDGLPAALAGVDADIVVVDNASVDGSAERAAAYPLIRLIRNSSNVGFARAVNQGAAQSDSRWIVLVNPDMELAAGSLRALYEFAVAHPANGIYGGRTMTPNGIVEPSSCWNLPSLWSTFCFSMGLSTARRRSALFDPESIGQWQRDSVREVGMVTGCLLMCPRTLWDELDGLDEHFFVYGEDADFSARARRRGYRPIVTPDAEAVHAVGVSSGIDGRKTSLLMAGKISYTNRHFDGWRRMSAVGLLRLAVFLRAVGSRVSGRGRKWDAAWANRGYWWNGFPS